MSPWSAGSDLEASHPPVFVPVVDLSQAGEARRAVVALASELRMPEAVTGRVALVATEAATNVARHGRGGHLILRGIEGGVGIELLALDAGPGMSDLTRAMRDGFSTGGSPGTGLGAIRRIADAFDLYSAPGKGTALFARILTSGVDIPRSTELGVVTLPYPGERVSGDAWAAAEVGDGCVIIVVDGLGHGVLAHDAAVAALRAFHQRVYATPVEIIEAAHGALRSTRGAAVAVAFIDRTHQLVRFAGIGNISCSVITRDAARSLASLNGTVGHEMRKVQEFNTPWSGGAQLVMHSDGIGARWRLEQYPGLIDRHPALVAAVLHRDHARSRDDATIVVARDARPLARSA